MLLKEKYENYFSYSSSFDILDSLYFIFQKKVNNLNIIFLKIKRKFSLTSINSIRFKIQYNKDFLQSKITKLCEFSII